MACITIEKENERKIENLETSGWNKDVDPLIEKRICDNKEAYSQFYK